MEVDAGVQVLPVKMIHGLGVLGVDMTVPNLLANDRPVLGFHQAVVAAMVRPRFVC
jgi:hypothetical protein